MTSWVGAGGGFFFSSSSSVFLLWRVTFGVGAKEKKQGKIKEVWHGTRIAW